MMSCVITFEDGCFHILIVIKQQFILQSLLAALRIIFLLNIIFNYQKVVRRDEWGAYAISWENNFNIFERCRWGEAWWALEYRECHKTVEISRHSNLKHSASCNN